MHTITASWKAANRPWVSLAVLSGVVLLAAVLATPTLHRGRSTANAAWEARQQTAELSRPHAAPPEKRGTGEAASRSLPSRRISADLKSPAPAAGGSSTPIERNYS